jgi:hypothetical protein
MHYDAVESSWAHITANKYATIPCTVPNESIVTSIKANIGKQKIPTSTITDSTETSNTVLRSETIGIFLACRLLSGGLNSSRH